MGNRIIDGAYNTMLERLQSATNPNFFFLHYDIQTYEVINFVVIPKHFFTSEIIIKRSKGLLDRPDYMMCSIDASSIPKRGKIFYVKDKQIASRSRVLKDWQSTLFLQETKNADLRGWVLDIMNCIDVLNKPSFTLREIYNFESILRVKYPANKHIKDKIKQQLQFLRDKGYLEFMGRGNYKLK